MVQFRLYAFLTQPMTYIGFSRNQTQVKSPSSWPLGHDCFDAVVFNYYLFRTVQMLYDLLILDIYAATYLTHFYAVAVQLPQCS